MKEKGIGYKVIRGKNKRADVDMSQGSILPLLLKFALPLMLGNLFQQMYNMVDTWVVGNFVSNEAYSAVGTVGPIINTLIGFFSGLASGAGVVISQYYGAKSFDSVKKTVHTALVLTLIMGVAFTILGIAMVPFMLDLMQTPEEVIPEATTYLQIYFSGLMGLMLYNMGSGILRAVGDSNRPFYFLVVCAVVNTVLDLYFVLKLNMGVAGVAWATIIAQAVSAVLVLLVLVRESGCIQVRIRELRIDWKILKKIFKVGIPAAVQMAITSFSNVFIQSYINAFGADFMAGWTTYSKIDMVMFLPMQSIGLAATTFVGQNLGMGKVDRAKKGARCAFIMAEISTLALMLPVLIFAPQLVKFFNAKEAVVAYGTQAIRVITPFYLTTCVNQVYSGTLRGAGNSAAPMVIMLSSFVVFRQIYMFAVSRIFPGALLPVMLGYPAGWMLCSVLTLLYYRSVPLDKFRVVGETGEEKDIQGIPENS